VHPLGARWSDVEVRARRASLGPVVRSGGADDLRLYGLTTDSRAAPPGSLFACVRGAASDGHRFAGRALRSGAVALLTDRPLALDVPQLSVPSVRAALGPLGALLAGDPADELRLVGVTGSNGKTTTSTLVCGALEAAGEAAGVVTTLGARVGRLRRDTLLTTPEAPELHRLLRWMLDHGARSAVVEASSIALDVGRVDGLHVDVAVFTGFEEDHLDHHGTLEQYWASKARLFTPERADRAVVVVDDPWGRRLADQTPLPVTRVATTPDADADVRVLGWRTSASGTFLVVADDLGRHPLRSRLVGRVHVGNLAAAWATGRRLGVEPDVLTRGLAAVEPPAGRNTLLRSDGGPLVVVDYAHTPRALAAALQTARLLTGPGGRVHLVLGARGRRDRYKRQGLGASARAADVVWLTNEGSHGERPQAIVEELRVGLAGGTGVVHTVLDRRAAITEAVRAAGERDVVLVVGRGHETTLTDGGADLPFDDAVVAREVLDVRVAERTAELVAEQAS
jgi:UDP-N-acetylmuramoyl-L-alanyl-D-glutamate--2,6-diaminopimelate ligase